MGRLDSWLEVRAVQDRSSLHIFLGAANNQYGAKIGIQIAHAGRKAQDAETPVAPSAIAFDETFKTPRALETEEVVRWHCWH